MGNLIEIAKPGRHRDMRGRVHELTEETLKAAASSYSKEVHQAPMVVGHPRQDAPAYGWVKGLVYQDGALQAECGDLAAGFAEAAQTGGPLAKRSAEFYGPAHKRNPVPGTYYLKHLGFLGAMPPAIKGLKDVISFSEDDDADESLTVSFAESDRRVSRLFRNLRDWFIAESGEEAADKVLPSWELDSLQEEAARADGSASPAFAEGDDEEDADEAAPGSSEGDGSSAAGSSGVEAGVAPGAAKGESDDPTSAPDKAAGDSTEAGDKAESKEALALKEREAELKKREDALKAREDALRDKSKDSRHQEHVSFCEGVVKSGRPLPCSSDLIVALMHRLDGDEDEEAISFGEGDERSALDVFKDEVLSKLPQTVSFSEVSGGGGGNPRVLTAHEMKTGIQRIQNEAESQGRYISGADALIQLEQENES